MSTIESTNILNPINVEGFAPRNIVALPRDNAEKENLDTQFNREDFYKNSDIDLNNYYNNKNINDAFSTSTQALIQSGTNLNNTMINAIQNGYTVQDACNIKQAQLAYKANAMAFNVAIEISTFELDV